MNVIKRDGTEVPFEVDKIINAIYKANEDCPESERIGADGIADIAGGVAAQCVAMTHAPNVEDIQELVETALMRHGAFDLAKAYIRYRYEHALRRKGNSIDGAILGIVNYKNEEVKQENSNKNPRVLPTQRDYIAGEVSKDITRRIMLPKEIMDAHDNGIIHFHDADYFIQKSHNCDLINLEDMLQNGTVISGTLIEKPHMFSTA